MRPQTLTPHEIVFSLAVATLIGCGQARETNGSQDQVTLASDALSVVAECGASIGACASEAQGDAAALATCRADFAACVEAGRPAPPARPAAAQSSPVGSCIDTLVACVTGDGDPPTCTADARACILAIVPPGDHPGGFDEDGGMPDDLPVPPTPPQTGMPDDVPPDPRMPDAGMAGGAGMAGNRPAASCMETFEACLAGGGSPRDCGQQLKECGRP